jgi:hypothetical protein
LVSFVGFCEDLLLLNTKYLKEQREIRGQNETHDIKE